jgi:hypothetical protein
MRQVNEQKNIVTVSVWAFKLRSADLPCEETIAFSLALAFGSERLSKDRRSFDRYVGQLVHSRSYD